MIRAAIFDLDGLLIDSEPLWREAERETFERVGIELSESMCNTTMGWRSDRVVAHWFERYPWSGPSPSQVNRELVQAVGRLIVDRGEAMPGVETVLESLIGFGLELGLASSSPPVLIEAAIARLGLQDVFSVLASAVDEDHGKPDPAVYLTAAERLGVDPSDCLAFEDSMPGIQSAKAAGMRVVAVPSASEFEGPAFGLADVRLASLADFSFGLHG